MKLLGYIDGVEVKFDFYSPNIFKAEIPKKMNGIYILELHAIDEAGNQTNMCSITVIIDFDKLSFKILDTSMICKVENKDLEFNTLKDILGFKTEDEVFEFKELPQEFINKELRQCN